MRQTERMLREELAMVYRLIAHFRMTDLIFNHISQRLPGTDQRFLINPYGLFYEEVTASNLVVIDVDGNKCDNSAYSVNPAGFVIHSAIHAARADAHCVLHTHTPAGCAVAAQKQGLLPLNQLSMQFYNRVGYHEYEGVALNSAEKERLVSDLGDHNHMIMRHHGLLTVGRSPGEAFIRMFYLEKACQIQISSGAGMIPVDIPPHDVCEHTARQLNQQPTDDDYPDLEAYDLLWQALQRLVRTKYQDYAD